MLLYASFFLLCAGYLSIWGKKTTWMQGFFSLASLLILILNTSIELVAFIPLTLLLGFTLALNTQVKGLGRFLLVTGNFLVGGALFYHFLPGFPPSFFLLHTSVNYGKVLAGFVLLSWLIDTMETKSDLIQGCKSSLPLALTSIGLFFLVAGTPSTSTNPLAILCYFFGSILPEEALLRGFLQKELFWMVRGGIKGQVLSPLLSACISCCFHLNWIQDLSLLPLLFFANLLCSIIYQMTKKIEGALVCHLGIYSLYSFKLGLL